MSSSFEFCCRRITIVLLIAVFSAEKSGCYLLLFCDRNFRVGLCWLEEDDDDNDDKMLNKQKSMQKMWKYTCVCVLCGLWMRPRRTKDVVERRAVCRLISFYCTTLVHSMCRGVKLTDAILKIKDEEKCAEFVLFVPSHLWSLRWISRHDLLAENYDIVDVSDGPRIRKKKQRLCVWVSFVVQNVKMNVWFIQMKY